MNEYVEILVRSLIAIGVLLVIARLDGVRQISQLTFYDYVTGITIGSIAGALCIDREIPILYSVIALVIFGIATILISFSTQKSIILRRLLTGDSKLIIDDGQFVEKNMKWSRFDINDVLRELRNQGYFNVADIQSAVLETNGQISVLPKSASRPPTAAEQQLQLPESGIVGNVIIDGKIMEQNLSQMKHNMSWLKDELNNQGVKDIKDVLLATLDDNDNLSLYFKGYETEKSTVFQ